MSELRLLAFDIFGTLADMSLATKESLESYGHQIKENIRRNDVWPGAYQKFDLSPEWEFLPPHDDVLSGIRRLRRRFFVTTFSNAPSLLQIRMLRHWSVEVDGITPLDAYKRAKPIQRAYDISAEHWQFHPSEIMVVTANESFGDLEKSVNAGMKSVLIRDEKIPTLHDLATALGA